MKSYLHGYHSRPIGATQGGFSSLWLGPASTKKVCLPSHRLVGELAHPIELLLHLVFSALTPTVGNICPHYFSQCNGPRSTEAQHKTQSPIFSFLHRKLPTPRTDPTITYFLMMFYVYIWPLCLRRGCLTNSPRAPTDRERQQRQVAAAQQQHAVWVM